MRHIRTFANRLPALCFGNRWAYSGREPGELSRLLSGSTGSTVEHEPLGRLARGFLHRTARVSIRGLTLTASSSSAVDVHVPEARRPTLIVPMHGRFSCRYGRLELDWAAGRSAMLLPALPRRGADTVRSGLWIDIDPQGLESLARAMLGERACLGGGGRVLNFEHPIRIPLRAASVDFHAVLMQLCALVDAYSAEQPALEHSGLDEAFSRVLVTMLLPHRLLEPSGVVESRSWQARAGLERACELARGRLHAALRLEDMERASGLSACALHRAFQERFGCTPRQWVLEQRLLAARAMLSRPDAQAGVREVALHLFGSASGFASRYRQRFGETPQASLQRARGPSVARRLCAAPALPAERTRARGAT